MFREDNIVIGFAIGVVVPVLAYLGITSLFEWLDGMGVENPYGQPYAFRDRTTALISVCFNLIPFRIFSTRRFDGSMRGVLVATGIFAIGWIYFYGTAVLNQG